jgi:hypothetical protein
MRKLRIGVMERAMAVTTALDAMLSLSTIPVSADRRSGSRAASVPPKLHDALLGLPRDDALRRAYLRRCWTLDAARVQLAKPRDRVQLSP